VKPTPTIIVDTREQTPWTFQRLPTVRGTLQFGDYSLTGLTELVTVERKSEDDLLACCGTERERFKRELRALRGFPFRLLVIETTAAKIAAAKWRSQLGPNHVWGALASWSVAYGLPVWIGGTPELCARYVERWLEQAARHVCERYAAARAIVDAFDKGENQ
jgi:ERCC4-type nuclease